MADGSEDGRGGSAPRAEDSTPPPDPGATTRRRRRDLGPHDSMHGRTMVFLGEGDLLAGRYRLRREIARGGMGVVYEAFDETLEAEVAVKVLPPELSGDEAAVHRLKREARAAIQLSHPNLLRLHTFDQDHQGAFLVMELLRGPTLDLELAREGALSPERVLEVARQAVAGLAAVHAAGMVHRDIKPSNLLWDREGEGAVLKLADFGIAAEVREGMARKTGVEASGTLLYVAPEQMRGKPATAQADQYSLAATLYELLTGAPPFSGPALSRQVLEVAPELPAEGPAHLGQALVRALAKDPAERFPDLDSFLAALDGDGGAASAAESCVGVAAAGGSGQAAADALAGTEGAKGEARERPDLESPEGPQGADRTPAQDPGGGSSLWWFALLVGFGVLAVASRPPTPTPTPTTKVDPREVPTTLAPPTSALTPVPPTPVPPTPVPPTPVPPTPVPPTPAPPTPAPPTPTPPAPTPPTPTPPTPAPPTPQPPTPVLPTRLPTSLPTPALPTPEPLLECRTNSLGMRFCRIRDDLWIASHELTQAQYDALLEHRPSTFTGEDHPVEGLALVDAQDAADELTSREAGTEHLLPGWRYRVPTEAQWEDAARAAPASEGVARTERAWFRANSETDDPGGYPCADWVTPPQPGRRCSTHPVGAKQGDALGLHDMLGNVWEWTTTAEAPGSELRVLKGGAWTSSLDQLDPGTRHPFDPGFGAHDHGVRFVLVPE